jgi:DNA-binding protein HU-beta
MFCLKLVPSIHYLNKSVNIYIPYCPKNGLLYNTLVPRNLEPKLITQGPRQLTELNKTTMNKSSIVDAVHGVLGGTKVQAEQAVETVINTIIDGLKKGDEVSIAGLGIFSVKQRAAREARNPRTGESIKVPAMKVPKFRAAKALKDAVK